MSSTNGPDSGGGRPPFQVVRQGATAWTIDPDDVLLTFVPMTSWLDRRVARYRGTATATAERSGIAGFYRRTDDAFQPVLAAPDMNGVTLRDGSGREVRAVVAGETYTISFDGPA